MLLNACGSEEGKTLPLENEEEDIETVQYRIDSVAGEAKDEERPFALYYHQLLMALASGDAPSFNELIHPDKGCYLIEAPGALPVITRISDVSQVVRQGSERPLLDFSDNIISFALQEESLPTIDCDSPEGFYSKEGTFVADVNTFGEEQIWKYVGLEEAEQTLIATLSQTINKTIINTAGFKAYFSKIDGQWYLTFFDIRIPCTA